MSESSEVVFERDWRRYGPVVGGRLGRRWRGIPPADREDLVADVGMIYLRELRDRRRPDHPKAWLRRVCDNRAKNWLRDRAANPGRSATLADPSAAVLQDEPDDRPGTAAEAEARIGAEQVRALLDRVDPADATLAHRLYIEDRNAKEVAGELGLGIRTVQRRGPGVLDAAAKWMREIEHPDFLSRLERILERVKAGDASTAQVAAIRRLASNGDPDCVRALRHIDEGLQAVALVPIIDIGARASGGGGVADRLVVAAHKAREVVIGSDGSGGIAGRLAGGDARGPGASIAELGARFGELGAAKVVAACTVAGATATACIAGVAGVGPLADSRGQHPDPPGEQRPVSDRELAVEAAQAVGGVVDHLESEPEPPPRAGDGDDGAGTDESETPTGTVAPPAGPAPAVQEFDPLADSPTTPQSSPSSRSAGGGSGGGQSAASKEFGGP